MARDTFIFRRTDWGRTIKRLTDQQRSELILLLLEYEPGGDITTDDPQLAIVLDFITGDIDRDAARYDAICKQRSDAARKRWGDAKAYKSMQMMQKHTSITDNYSESDYEYDYEYGYESEGESERLIESAAAAPESSLTAIRTYFTDHEYRSNPEEFYQAKSSYPSFAAEWKKWANEWEAKYKPQKVNNAPTSDHYYQPGELDRRAKLEMVSTPPADGV